MWYADECPIYMYFPVKSSYLSIPVSQCICTEIHCVRCVSPADDSTSGSPIYFPVISRRQSEYGKTCTYGRYGTYPGATVVVLVATEGSTCTCSTCTGTGVFCTGIRITTVRISSTYSYEDVCMSSQILSRSKNSLEQLRRDVCERIFLCEMENSYSLRVFSCFLLISEHC